MNSNATESSGERDDTPAKPPTTRTIALAAGVSCTTVSMALRNHPAIAAATRERIQRIAREMGYVPDPEVSKLMHHLQLRQKTRFHATIAALTTIRANGFLHYASALRAGAVAAARKLGYTVDVFHLDAGVGFQRHLQRVLWTRGVEGILLLPMAATVNLDTALEWERFAVVMATGGVLAPHFHRVAPDQFSNTLLLCRNLASLGRRRIGLVLDQQSDVVAGHRFCGAIAWQNTVGGTETVAPYIYEGEIDERVRRWFEREHPDAIVAAGEPEARAAAAQLGIPLSGGPVVFAVEERTPADLLPGIDQRPGQVGADAMGMLHLLLQRGERGVPAIPNLTCVPGGWVPAAEKKPALGNAAIGHPRESR